MTANKNLAECCKRIQARVRAMQPAQRAGIERSLTPDDRKLLGKIMGSAVRAAVNPERAREREEMDRRMGLTKQKIGCKREGSTLYLGVPVDEKPAQRPSAAAARPRGAQPKKPVAAPQRATPRAGARSEYERELDRRMGLAGTRAGCTRSGNTLILGG